MVIIYTTSGCASCRKAKAWLKDNHIEFVEKNLFTTLLKEEEIKYLLSRCENGTSDLLSLRSKLIKSLKKDVDDLTMNELIDLIQHNPSILKRPIILSEHSLVVGYDDDEITTLIPESLRVHIDEACTPSCASYDLCKKVRQDEKEPV